MFFDIGAHNGHWAIANLPLTQRIISIEAMPQTFSKLQQNLKDLSGVLCLQGAVHNSPTGEVTFYECHCDVLNTTNKEWLTDPSSRFGHVGYKFAYSVKTIRIDDLIQKYGLPDLVKIDVEGGEYEAILTLTQKVPLICFEWAAELKDILIKCCLYLQSLGFTEFFIQNGDTYTFRPTEWYSFETLVEDLDKNAKPKNHWGMIWAH